MLVQIPFFCQGSLRRLFAFFFQCHLCLVFGSCNFGSRHDIFIFKRLLLLLTSSHAWREELQTNKEKDKTCLFTGQADVQHMSFTCVTYDSDSPDNNLCDNNNTHHNQSWILVWKINGKNVPYNTSWTFLTVKAFRKDSKDPMDHDYYTNHNSHEEQNKVACFLLGCP